MFANSVFNGDISDQDTSNVKYMSNMFKYSKFNGDISKWNVSSVQIMEDMFYKSILKREHKLPNWYQYIN